MAILVKHISYANTITLVKLQVHYIRQTLLLIY